MRFDNISMNGPLLGNSATIASASTTDLSTVAGNAVTVTGTTTIDSFGTVQAGAVFTLTFQDVLVLTYNATSLILPGNASIATAAGDVAVLESLGSGNWKCTGYQRQVVIPPARGYNTLTKTEFDALVAISGLVPGEWYNVTGATWVGLDVSVLVIADSASSVTSDTAFLYEATYTTSAQGRLSTSNDVNSFVAVSGVVKIGTTQAASYTSGVAAGTQIIIAPSYITNVGDDSTFILKTNVKDSTTGQFGSLDPTFTTFTAYPNGGQGYNTVTKSEFDTLVGASGLVPGQWYYVQAAYPSPLFAVDWDLLVVANSTSTINNSLVYAFVGGFFSQGYSDSPTLTTGFSFTLLSSVGLFLTPTQAASYVANTFPASSPIIISFGGGYYETTTYADGTTINNKNVRNVENGQAGDLSLDFATFYPYSGDYAPTISGFDSVTSFKNFYSIQGNVMTSTHIIDVDNSSAASSGTIVISPPTWFAIDTATGRNSVGSWSLQDPRNYPNISDVSINQASGDINAVIAFDTPVTAFRIYLTVQSKLA